MICLTTPSYNGFLSTPARISDIPDNCPSKAARDSGLCGCGTSGCYCGVSVCMMHQDHETYLVFLTASITWRQFFTLSLDHDRWMTIATPRMACIVRMVFVVEIQLLVRLTWVVCVIWFLSITHCAWSRVLTIDIHVLSKCIFTTCTPESDWKSYSHAYQCEYSFSCHPHRSCQQPVAITNLYIAHTLSQSPTESPTPNPTENPTTVSKKIAIAQSLITYHLPWLHNNIWLLVYLKDPTQSPTESPTLKPTIVSIILYSIAHHYFQLLEIMPIFINDTSLSRSESDPQAYCSSNWKPNW